MDSNGQHQETIIHSGYTIVFVVLPFDSKHIVLHLILKYCIHEEMSQLMVKGSEILANAQWLLLCTGQDRYQATPAVTQGLGC